ncbi:hypothetical protein SEEM5278_08493 [Salmonella enterica subsp. enterica serovar Montevideo str. CT_02035278]|uniref:Uncharacterized protein n=1 Tax=Salmonella paratyphi B (strain ATCC BAA-1250 / SPB7) TaxID=1016998 RepID=A0A6C6YY12_SALPB|nr:hypothetical protein SPAB_00153 [Salmonella enterica subsp. enterica serovar Paratyphi B str. SPB7]AGK65756.1 hypothetical protein TY21A_00630 [Salmonella enterica subsp. enterica serovar Typhi str. Ty21a]EFY44212.1 hypothetical protein SEEM054_08553 [Salmonella enterica subsp. enterica serovar Montevideo str. NC_MB110209-0054]EFY44543.1 hypothetical protein SEEM675_11652 [Salmonella enterica subsp. enterica serovar Montevideo str. OH_2009072675]EFY53670.1 hypothetical protein SEEM19N_12640 
MPVSPLLTTLSHKFPLEGVYGAEEKLVKQVTTLTEVKKPMFTANICVD